MYISNLKVEGIVLIMDNFATLSLSMWQGRIFQLVVEQYYYCFLPT